MKFFIAGGAGFFGSNFVDYILRKYPDSYVINFDKLNYPNQLKNLEDIYPKERHEFIHGNILRKNQIYDAFKEPIDIVINFIDEKNDQDLLNVNVNGLFNLLEIAKEKKVKKFIQISTNQVYGNFNFANENSLINPLDLYSVSKVSADLLSFAYFNTSKMPIIIVRFSNMYGCNILYNIDRISFLVDKLLKGDKIKIDDHEESKYDWIHILDCCRALDTVLHYGENGEIYNVGSGDLKSNSELVRIICEFLKIDKEFITIEFENKYKKTFSINCDKIKETLRWKPTVNFEHGLKDIIEWHKTRK